MTLAILIPLAMIRGTIQERQAYRQQAVADIARSYAGAQALSGPVLVVPYVETVEVEEKRRAGRRRKVLREQAGTLDVLPGDARDLGARCSPTCASAACMRSAPTSCMESADAAFEATMPADAQPAAPTHGSVSPGSSYGHRRRARARRARRNCVVDGVAPPDRTGRSRDGAGHPCTPGGARAGGETIRLDTRLDFVLGGTESLALVPLGRSNRFALDSTWPHPQFTGSFLPRDAHRSTTRVSARSWEISSLATNAQTQYLGGQAVAARLERAAR